MISDYRWSPWKRFWRHVLAHRLATPAKKVGAYLLSHTKFRAWATLKTGQQIKVDLSSSVGRSIWFRGAYEPEVVTHIVRILRQGDAFIDVGANVGYFSLVAANLVGKEGEVHGFEPSRSVYELFKASIAANAAHNVHASPIALWSSSGMVRLAKHHNSGLTHVVSGAAPSGARGLEDAAAMTLDEYARSFIHRPIKLVKIDVEGAEVHVLRGMTEILGSQRPHLIVEAADWLLSRLGHGLEDMFALLEGYGYQAFDLEGHATRSAGDARKVLGSRGVWNLLFTPDTRLG